MTTFVVRDARPGTKACDTLSHVTLAQAQALRGDGFELLWLYASVVTAEDLAAATGAGLEVGFVLEGLATATEPTADLGSRMAHAAAGRLRSLGVPPGVTLFSDLEGAGRAPQAWIEFANAAADATSGLGDIPGAYIGAGTGLTSAEIYGLRTVRYWKGGSRVVDRNGQLAEPSCGWCVVQGFPIDYMHPASGLEIDLDVVWQDYAGRTAAVIAAQPALAAVA
jgi:hypothetical protein